MNEKLYVGGLPYSTTEDQLQDIFAAHGTVVSARVITDKFTGRSRGFGFRGDGFRGRGGAGHRGAAMTRSWAAAS